MTTLQLSLLGHFAVHIDGNPVEIHARASQSLFSYLALHRDKSLRRELLAGQFWPDSSESNARSNLRHALWQIRTALGRDVFPPDKITISLDPEVEIEVDAERIRVDALASLDELLDAADLYQGDLLPGFYDDWVILERERLRGAYVQLMERVLEGLTERKRWPEVSEWAERWIALGHVPEPAFRALMVAHAARGDQAGIAAVYARCVDTLERELGVESSPQTQMLREQLMEGGLPAMLKEAPDRKRYELGEEIGRGGMGEVYRAKDTWLEREVAVKVLSSEALGPDGRERLLAEAQAAARLNHPNVVSVYDVGEIDGEPFIVMELVEGETLHAHRPESQGERLAIVLEICAALEHAHAQGIIHRDLKPENVMLAPDGTARLMDFGLASRRVEAPQAPEGSTAGTVYYLSPEVLKGEPANVQSDLYALGVLLYELLTGELPFSGKDPMEVITQHLEVDPKPPGQINPEIRPALEALMLRLLSKQPADRPLSAAAVAEVLEAVAPEEIQLGEPAPGEPPFKGLEYYDVEDAEIFFGREVLVERLMDRLRDERFLAVIVGASGSGKSSVARAGLVPALSDGKNSDWLFRLMTPTERPTEALAVALIPSKEDETETAPSAEDLASDSTNLHQAASWLVETEGAKKLLLVVDQLEELFTLCDDEQERTAFIDNLLTAADPEMSGPTVVVITLRADFYPHCAKYPALREALARNQEYIGPMNTAELRRAIEEPALRGGWKFQSGLVDLMLRDVRGEPGALPLLSHALLETWKRRSRRTMTLRGYAKAGGVRRAIARSAEQVYNQELGEQQRGIARNIFLRLTELGEGTEDTRRRVTHLITLSEEHVEVAHEALIREWPRLRGWLDEDREGLRIHRHLTEAAQAWAGLDKDPGELYRGGRLVQAMEWSDEQRPELNPLESEYLGASQALAEQREAEREAQVKRLRRRAIYLGGALVAAVALAFAAASFGRQASDSAEQADLSLGTAQAANTEVVMESEFRATAEADALVSEAEAVEERAEAEVQADLARSRELAAAAVSVLDDNPELSMLLALQSIEESPPVFGASASGVIALRESLLTHRLIKRIPIGDNAATAEISPDGSTIYVWSPSEGTFLAIDVESEDVLWRHLELPQEIGWSLMDMSPDGAFVVASLQSDNPHAPSQQEDDRPSQIIVLRTSDGSMETILHPGTCPEPVVRGGGFSPDGRWLVVWTGNEHCFHTQPENDWFVVYDTSTWEEVYNLPIDNDPDDLLQFTASSDQILVYGRYGNASMWSFPELELIQDFGSAGLAAVSPDGQRIVLGPNTREILTETRPRVVDATGRQLFFLEMDAVGMSDYGFIFSTDGSKIVALTWGRGYIFDGVNGRLLTVLGEPGLTTHASFSGDANRLVTVIAGDVLLWDLADAEVGIPIELNTAYGFWINPDWVLDGPKLAVHVFAWYEDIGIMPVITLLDDTGVVMNELLGTGVQLPDGRFVVFVFNPEINPEGEVDQRNGPLVIWDPETDEIIELTHCSALDSELDGINTVECPGGEPMFFDPAFAEKLHPIVVVSNDGAYFASAAYTTEGEPRPVWVWDSETLEVRSKFEIPYEEELLAGGSTWIATWKGIEGTIHESTVIRDVESGEMITELQPDHLYELVIEISPDGSLMYAADIEGGVVVYDTMTWELVAIWQAHDGVFRGLAHSPDGQRLVTTGNDEFVKIWDVSGIRDRSDVYGSPPLLDRIPAPAPKSSDAIWLSENQLVVFLADGPRWFEVSVSVEGVIAEAQARLTRSFTLDECSTYLIDPCPTLEDIKSR
jgi:DNA-binding SARP family transcriptional activator/WD40 repeat protein